MRELSLYFHIPYCKQKCFYCDFNSYANKTNTVDMYFKCIIKEIDLYKEVFDAKVNTIFFGGGTPSFVDVRNITSVLDKCSKVFSFSSDIEITLESNPDSLTFDKLLQYKKMGINRLSIGLQAWQDELLSKIGRIHSINQFAECFENARQAEFNNINIDLMFGLPDQNINNWEETLDNVIRLRPEHISSYGLKIEEGTKLCCDYDKGILKLPDEDTEREMYHKAENFLMKQGYERYEISNFALPDFECRHNLAYWTYKEYIGFGAGAHSFLNNIRTENACMLEEYLDKTNNSEFAYISKDTIDRDEQIKEFIITGLRLSKGINKEEFENKFGIEIEKLYTKRIYDYIEYGLICDTNKVIRLTGTGFDLSNTILSEFV